MKLPLNRQARRRQHKREVKKYYSNWLGYCGDPKWLEARDRRKYEENKDSYWYRKHPPRNGGYEYWQRMSHNRWKQACKRMSNKQVRNWHKQQFRMSQEEDYDDVQAASRADYRRIWDLEWELD